jgi:Kef-type K+ transport system membrane component KefB
VNPADTRTPVIGRGAVVFGYAVMVALAVGAFLYVRSIGNGLVAPDAAPAATGPVVAHTSNTVFELLVSLTAIILTARVMGAIFHYLHQPAVIGEVLGGIMLGPSLLGRFAPNLYALVLPPGIAPFLSVHAQVGVILYMFIVGLELDTRVVRTSGHATLAISHASIIVPFVLGTALALLLYPALSSNAVPFTVFALFIGVAMSITAFPVLARILTDRRMHRTRMGAVALTCAAIDDVTAWCLLALVVGIAQSRASDAVRPILLTVAFIAVVVTVIGPLVRRMLPRIERSAVLSRSTLALIVVGVLIAAMATEAIGIHGIFGAFLFGAIIPSTSPIVGQIRQKLEDLVAVLFLPVFFAFTGMRTEVGLIAGVGNWLLCGTIVLVACAGKFGGTVVASRLTGLGWRDASALGVLMNTRGLVELIVLNIGLDLQLISPRLFTMLVIMAIVTTVMTTPILQLIVRKHPWVEMERSERSATA